MDPLTKLVLFVALPLLLVWAVTRWRKRPALKGHDHVLLMLSETDAWTLEDAFEGLQILGAIGSGKTTGSGAAVAMAFLRYGSEEKKEKAS